jgi:hypothetical protein
MNMIRHHDKVARVNSRAVKVFQRFGNFACNLALSQDTSAVTLANAVFRSRPSNRSYRRCSAAGNSINRYFE